MVACLFGASSLPTLHFCCPPSRKFTLSAPIHFEITLSINQPVVVTVSLLTADYHPHILSISPQQIYHFAESTTHKFENLCIQDPDLQANSEKGTVVPGMENGEISVEERQKQKESCRIMVEAATSAASTVIVSDTIYADKEELQICDVSQRSVQNLPEKIWVLLNKEIAAPSITVKYGETLRPAEEVRQDGKLLRFMLPALGSNQDGAENVDGIQEMFVHIDSEQGHADLKLAITKSISSIQFPNGSQKVAGEEWLQVRSLFTFASEGDPLALLAPMAAILSVSDNDGCNALHLAARNKQNFALKTLLTALRESNDPVALENVINAQNLRGQTPLHCAVRAGDADCVHYLVSAGAKRKILDKGDNMVTHYLGEVYNEAIYKEILETSVAEDLENHTNGDVAESSLLASKNSDGYTPAHIAVRKLKLGLLEAFIEAGAPVDIPDSNGETPLVSALLMDDTDIASLLIKNKCDVNVVTNTKDTPLWIACRKKNLLLIGRLLDAGADLNIPDKDGKVVKDIEDEEIKKILNGERIQPPEAHQEEGSELPSSSSHSNTEETTRLSAFSYRLHALNSDDISSMDYLTRLRLSKLLDSEDKWAKLAEHLGCEHMVEFIKVCADETSSPTMMLLDQYEQVPNANLTTVAKCLEEMGETAGVRLLRPPPPADDD